MLHNVTNGCPRDFPSGILSVAGYAKHAVRCCNITEDECITPQPCHREATYEEALKICSMQGKRLCPRTERLNDICCKTGCYFDERTVWVEDDKSLSTDT